jgi:O-antigen/teichoic acid export membrane protein
MRVMRALRGRTLVQRARERNPFPKGSVTIAAWLVITGVTAYLFLAVSGRALGSERYSALAVLWAIAFAAAPGFFQPLEQEVARALAARRARGVGGAPVIRRGAAAGGVLAAALVIVILLAALVFPIVDSLFDGETLLLWGLVIMLVGYFAEHLTRGVLAGYDRFGPYGLLTGSEGLLRLVACAALAVIGVESAGPYGILIGIAPFAGVAIALSRQHGLVVPGPPASWAEISVNIGLLVAGSALALALLNAAPVVVKLLSSSAESQKASWIFAGAILSRVPLYFFQAVQATFVPELSGQRGAGEHEAFRSGLRKLTIAVIVIGAASVLVSAVLGPWAVRTFFGSDYQLGVRDMALLALGASIYMLALTLSQALIALEHHGRAALGWVIGVVVFVFAVVAGSGDVLLRTELAYVAGSTAALIAMTALLWRPLRETTGQEAEAFLEAVRSEPVEP